MTRSETIEAAARAVVSKVKEGRIYQDDSVITALRAALALPEETGGGEAQRLCPECQGAGTLGRADDGRLIACEHCGGHEDGAGTGYASTPPLRPLDVEDVEEWLDEHLDDHTVVTGDSYPETRSEHIVTRGLAQALVALFGVVPPVCTCGFDNPEQGGVGHGVFCPCNPNRASVQVAKLVDRETVERILYDPDVSMEEKVADVLALFGAKEKP